MNATGIIDAWMQHPGKEFLSHPMFDSLRRWQPDLAYTDPAPEQTLAAMDATDVQTGLLCAWWGPTGPLSAPARGRLPGANQERLTRADRAVSG